MKTNLLKSALLSLFAIALLSSCSEEDNYVGPSTSTDAIITVPFFALNAAGETPSDPTDLVYEIRKQNPVIAPDGHQLTFAEFSSVRGRADIQCQTNAVEVELSLTGLIPNGVYTIWNVVFDDPGMDPTDPMLGLDGLGAAGKGDGSDNAFTASATGKATITVRSPGGNLSMVQNTPMGDCPLTENFEWHVVGAYHIDGKTHGSNLGPDGTAIEQFGFIFKNAN